MQLQPATVCERFVPRLNLTDLIEHFAQPSPKFYGGQKLREFGSVFDLSHFWHSPVSKRSCVLEI